MANDPKKAEYYYNKAIEINPSNVNALKNSAILYTRIGDRNKALELWKKVRELKPNDEDVKKVFTPRR